MSPATGRDNHGRLSESNNEAVLERVEGTSSICMGTRHNSTTGPSTGRYPGPTTSSRAQARLEHESIGRACLSSLQNARFRLSRQNLAASSSQSPCNMRTDHNRNEVHHPCLGNDIDSIMIRRQPLQVRSFEP